MNDKTVKFLPLHLLHPFFWQTPSLEHGIEIGVIVEMFDEPTQL